MATSVTFNGTSYSIPVVGERQWGTNVSNFLIAVAGNALSKAGGSFVLTTADVNFGATYGLVTAYLKSASSNISSAGVIRFANNEGIGWRNFANAANLILLVNASDRLEFGGVAVPTISSTDTLTNKTMSGASNTFTNLPVGTTGVTAIANGGTGQSAIVTTPTASTIPAWDANANLSANNFINEYATVATAGGTTTLTVASKRTQFFTGTLTQTVTLPVASTLTIGHTFYIRNLSTGVVTINSSGANLVLACQPGEWLTVTCILASGTTAASWSTFAKLAINPVATGALALPSGSAAQRPTAVAGQVRLNTDSNSFEGYTNGAWSSIGGGLNELPQKNYLKTWSDAVVAPGTLSTLASTTANLVSLTAFYASTGGSAFLTNPASSTLRGTTNYLTAMGTADSSGASFIQFPAQALEGSDLGKPVSISFDVSGVTADGNWDVVVVRYTSAGVYGNILSVAGNASGATPVSAKLPTGTTTFNGFFVPDSTTAGDLYALRLRHLVSNAAIRVDTLFIGPQPIRVGNARTGRQSYTPTGPFTVTTTYSGQWSRDNEDILIDLDIEFSGAPTGTNASFTHAQVLNGLGLTVDTTKLPNVANSVIPCGTWSILDSGVTVYGGPAVVSNTTVDLYTAAGVLVTKTTPLTIANLDNLSVSIRLPITGWSSNITMADRAVEFYLFNTGATTTAGADNSAATTGYGTAGTPIIAINSVTGGNSNTTFTMTSQQPIQSTDRVELEFSSGTGWTPVTASGAYSQIQGGASYGAGAYVLSDGQVRVGFGNKGAYPIGVLYSADGQVWSGLSSTRWRVRVVKGGAQVGYPISSANIVGRTDGNAPATGMVGQKFDGVVTSTSGTASGTAKDAAQITALPSGTWELFGKAYIFSSVASAITGAKASISTTSNTHESTSQVGWTLGTTSSEALLYPCPRYVTVAAGTTQNYYLVISATVSSGTVATDNSTTGMFYAVRIA